MTRAAVFVAFMGVLCLHVAVDARAEPIRITGGVLDFNGEVGSGPTQLGELSVFGNRGFSAVGFVASDETIVRLAVTGGLEPGSTRSTEVAIMGLGLLNGRVTLDDMTYPDINGMLSMALLFIDVTGTIDLPAWQNAPVTISAPFKATGFFLSHIPSSSFDVPIRGSGGTLTLNLVPEPGGTWTTGTFRYDFVAMPTPEPGTLTMVGGALVGAAMRARKRLALSRRSYR
jgi:hypothetical protein